MLDEAYALGLQRVSHRDHLIPFLVTSRTRYPTRKEETTGNVNAEVSLRPPGLKISKDRQQTRGVVEVEVTEDHVCNAREVDA